MHCREDGGASMLAAVPMADPRPLPQLNVLQPSSRPERSDAARNREAKNRIRRVAGAADPSAA